MINRVEVSQLIGKTLASIVGMERDQLDFTTESGEVYRMEHFQDCCEVVNLEEVVGELNDLVGSPILMAEKVTEEAMGAQSSTWTFYKFATLKGYVTLRWFGSSSGYYSEEVDFHRIS